jgi:hypothetical protein
VGTLAGMCAQRNNRRDDIGHTLAQPPLSRARAFPHLTALPLPPGDHGLPQVNAHLKSHTGGYAAAAASGEAPRPCPHRAKGASCLLPAVRAALLMRAPVSNPGLRETAQVAAALHVPLTLGHARRALRFSAHGGPLAPLPEHAAR